MSKRLMIMQSTLEGEGRVWFRKALNTADLEALSIAANTETGSRLSQIDLTLEATRILKKIDNIAGQLISNVKPVRLVSFNKTSKINWALPWHQDRVIAVDEKHTVPGFDNWSQKEGIWHCQPPIDLLNKMMFARVHLDDSDESNGCLELALGSHHHGKILSKEVEGIVNTSKKEMCIAKRGDIVFVKALTLHRSRSSQSMSPRKALRIDYSNRPLPSPLSWNFK